MAIDYRLAWPLFDNHVDAARTFIGEVWQGIGVYYYPVVTVSIEMWVV